MKAIVCTKYGTPDVLELREVPKPVPQDDEVLIKIHAAAATAADAMMRRGTPLYARLFLGWNKPKHSIPGTGFAGQIEATGKDVKQFQQGDRVFGETGLNFGSNAEYICMPSNGLLKIEPANLTCKEAACICDGTLTALNFLENVAKIRSGQKILINGASGSIGTAAVQIAKYYKAEVTGVCSTRNIELVKSLGADRVIDYTCEDFTQTNSTYDIIFDTIGKSSFYKCRSLLTPKGIYMSSVLKLPLLLQMSWTSKIGSKKAMFSATGLRPIIELDTLLQKLVELIKEEKIKIVMDRSYLLEQTSQAHRYIEKGHKRGNVTIAIAD